MSYQPAITIKKALERIHANEFVLPSIQREFVWSELQICHLFDSLMQGYPIGSFLFWSVKKEQSKEFVFYDFLQSFHETKARHCKKRQLLNEEDITAILDGQQRLTSLNIGLRGTFASKLPRLRRDNPAAYPARRLHLNIAMPAEENEQKMAYDFRFLTPEQASKTDETHYWFPVHQILEMENGVPLFNYVKSVGLVDNPHAFPYLDRLYAMVHRDGVISFYAEEAQDLDKVLNIFIRMNSGGKPLTYSDMLLSIATAQWKEVDAREEIHQFVDEINDIGIGFNFSKDVVLKSGLMLCDIPSIGFKVTNFNAANMKLLETNWSRIKGSLRLAVNLLADFGFSAEDLSADSVLIPIAYYVHRRQLTDTYRTAKADEADRESLRRWIIRSLVKPGGIWGSGLDTLLLALRTALKDHGKAGFPTDAVEAAMAKRGKSLRFDDEDVELLLDLEYRDMPTFALLALLYPGLNFRNAFHIDHVFPRSRFTPKKLAKAGIVGKKAEDFMRWSEMLPNLQLLEGHENKQKCAALPAEWVEKRYPEKATRAMYCERHDLGKIPADLDRFEHFVASRRERMKAKLTHLLGMEHEPVLV